MNYEVEYLTSKLLRSILYV